MPRQIAVLCAIWLLSIQCVNGQGVVTNSHSVEAIRAAMNSPIPPQIQQQARQFDAQVVNSRNVGDQTIAILNDTRYSRTNEIVQKLLRAIDDSSNWIVRVLDSNPKVENAFTVGGTYIYVYTGLIDNVRSDDELAFILGHEISHSRLKHNLRRSEDFSNLLASIIELSGSMSKAENRRDKMELVGGSIKALYSREDEREADALGAYVAKQAGYDPALGVAFFRRMMNLEKSADAQNDAQIAQAKANVQQQITNCENLKAQWNSQPRIRTPQNAQLVNNTCKTAQNAAQQLNSSVSQFQVRSVLLRTHPVDSDRINALVASVQYLQGSRSLQSLSGIGQGYNVYVAMNLNQPSQTTGNPTMPGTTDICIDELKTKNLPQGPDVSDFMAECTLRVLYGLDVKERMETCTQDANSKNMPMGLARQSHVRNCLTDGKFAACGKEAESTNAPRGSERAVFMRECLNRNLIRQEQGGNSQGQGFSVSAGLYATQYADYMREKLDAAGIPHYSVQVQLPSASGGTATQIRAGPFKTQEEAERVREKLSGIVRRPGPVEAN